MTYSILCFKKALFVIVLFFGLFLFTSKLNAQVAVQDSLALVDLYNSTNGNGWTNHTNWLTANPVSSWFGVTVSSGRVTKLFYQFISNNNLSGTLPSSIGNLTKLNYLCLMFNHLTGNIPSSIGNLTELTDLLLGSNQLNGAIPASIGNLVNLQSLWLNDNKLSGPIPSTLSNIPRGTAFFIFNNSLTFAGLEQIVSSNFGQLYYDPQKNIPIIQSGNKLSVSVGGTPSNNTYKWYKDQTLVATIVGDSTYTTSVYGKYSVSVTNTICNKLTIYSDTLYPPSTNINDSLALVDLYYSTNGNGWINHTNWLTSAPVCTWYGVEVSNGRVIKLFFRGSGNNLIGSIPMSIGNLSQLTHLHLGGNQLSGNIPSSIGNLSNLQEVWLWLNHLSGSIPESIGNLTNLRIIDFYDNDISGTIPESIGNLTNLKELYLPLNDLTGNIPTSLGNLTNLTDLVLYGNKLSGNIPESIGNLPYLTSCWLSDNQLNGAIPLSFNNLSSTAYIKLSNNKFTFSGIEELIPSHINLTYYPQLQIPIGSPNNKLSVSAGGSLSNNTYKWYKDTTLVATIIGDSTYIPTNFDRYSVAVTNAIASKLTLYSDTLSVNNLSALLCNPLGSTTLISNISGSNYQWQLSTDNTVFNNISNNSNYSGANSGTLILANIPSSFYGHQYRCVVDGNNSGIYTLQFQNIWTGTASTIWNNPANWSCGNIPDENTDVLINSGNVIVSEDAVCRSLAAKPNTSLTVNTGITLTVKH